MSTQKKQREFQDAIVMYDYSCSGVTELSVRKGQHVLVSDVNDQGWCLATLRVISGELKIGWIPRSYVYLLKVGSSGKRKSRRKKRESQRSKGVHFVGETEEEKEQRRKHKGLTADDLVAYDISRLPDSRKKPGLVVDDSVLPDRGLVLENGRVNYAAEASQRKVALIRRLNRGGGLSQSSSMDFSSDTTSERSGHSGFTALQRQFNPRKAKSKHHISLKMRLARSISQNRKMRRVQSMPSLAFDKLTSGEAKDDTSSETGSINSTTTAHQEQSGYAYKPPSRRGSLRSGSNASEPSRDGDDVESDTSAGTYDVSDYIPKHASSPPAPIHRAPRKGSGFDTVALPKWMFAKPSSKSKRFTDDHGSDATLETLGSTDTLDTFTTGTTYSSQNHSTGLSSDHSNELDHSGEFAVEYLPPDAVETPREPREEAGHSPSPSPPESKARTQKRSASKKKKKRRSVKSSKQTTKLKLTSKEIEQRKEELYTLITAMGYDEIYAAQAIQAVDPCLPHAAELCFHWMEEHPNGVRVRSRSSKKKKKKKAKAKITHKRSSSRSSRHRSSSRTKSRPSKSPDPAPKAKPKPKSKPKSEPSSKPRDQNLSERREQAQLVEQKRAELLLWLFALGYDDTRAQDIVQRANVLEPGAADWCLSELRSTKE